MKMPGLLTGNRKAAAALLLILLLVSGAGPALPARNDRSMPVQASTHPAGWLKPLPPGPTPTPQATPTAFLPLDPTPTALAAPTLVQLTEGGCCPTPSWSPDSEWVLFLDRPSPDHLAGLYGVPASGGRPTLVHARIGVYSRDQTLVAYREGGWRFVERWADGKRWFIPSEGRSLRFSPSGDFVAWEVASRSIRFPDTRQRTIWVARSDGSDARNVVTVNGGVFIGWGRSEQDLLVSGRLSPQSPAGIWQIRVADGAGRLVWEVEKPRSLSLSPNGEWLAYFIAFDTDPENNGLWVMRTKGGSLRKLDLFGAYRWRDDGSLLVLPLTLEEAGPALWQVDAESGESWRLTDPSRTPLQVANNDWQVSPDGSRLVFYSAEDHNLWLLRLPVP